MLESSDFSLFSSPFDLSASLGSGSGSISGTDSGSERDTSSPQRTNGAPRAGPPASTNATSGPAAGAPSQQQQQQQQQRAHPSLPPVKSHLKPHVNASTSTSVPTTTSSGGGRTPRPMMPQHQLPPWQPRSCQQQRQHGTSAASGDGEYNITITSPMSTLSARDLPRYGDDEDSLINGMRGMSMSNYHHQQQHHQHQHHQHQQHRDEPRVVDIAPASGYYEARKPRLRNGGLNARLYNAFRVTTKDHLSVNTRSPSLRGSASSRHASFSSDASMTGDSPYARGGGGFPSPFAGGWESPGGPSGGLPPNFSLAAGGAGGKAAASFRQQQTNAASFNTSFGSSVSAGSFAHLRKQYPGAGGAGASATGDYPSAQSPGPRLSGAHIPLPLPPRTPAGGVGARSGAPQQQPPSLLGLPSSPLPPAVGVDYHGGGGMNFSGMSMNMSGMSMSGMMSPLSPPLSPPFGIKYKTELCLNWMNTGTCVYGNKCHFGHGDTDLRARKRVRNFKTQMCCDPAREGARRCMFSARCNYLHPSEPLRRAEPVPYFDEDYLAMLTRDFPGNDFPFGIYV